MQKVFSWTKCQLSVKRFNRWRTVVSGTWKYDDPRLNMSHEGAARVWYLQPREVLFPCPTNYRVSYVLSYDQQDFLQDGGVSKGFYPQNGCVGVLPTRWWRFWVLPTRWRHGKFAYKMAAMPHWWEFYPQDGGDNQILTIMWKKTKTTQKKCKQKERSIFATCQKTPWHLSTCQEVDWHVINIL